MARKYTTAHVTIPYIDRNEDGTSARTYADFRLKSSDGFCKRRVKRIVRKWLQHKLDKKIDIQELRKCLKRGFYK